MNALDRSYGYCADWSEGSLEGIDHQPMIASRIDESVRTILRQLPPRISPPAPRPGRAAHATHASGTIPLGRI